MQDLLAILFTYYSLPGMEYEDVAISDDSHVDIDYNLKVIRQEMPFMV